VDTRPRRPRSTETTLPASAATRGRCTTAAAVRLACPAAAARGGDRGREEKQKVPSMTGPFAVIWRFVSGGRATRFRLRRPGRGPVSVLHRS
jgi:hypothetical protein